MRISFILNSFELNLMRNCIETSRDQGVKSQLSEDSQEYKIKQTKSFPNLKRALGDVLG